FAFVAGLRDAFFLAAILISLACPTIERSPTASTLGPYNRTFLANYYQNQEMSRGLSAIRAAPHVDHGRRLNSNRASIWPHDVIQEAARFTTLMAADSPPRLLSS